MSDNKRITTVKDLIAHLQEEDQNAEVYLGVEGYSNYDVEGKCYWPGDVGIIVSHAENGGVLLRDYCPVDGEERKKHEG